MGSSPHCENNAWLLTSLRVGKTKNDNCIMKINYLRAGALALAVGGFTLVSGCVIRPYGEVYVAPPVVEVDTPEVAIVPDTYVVGMINGGYFYLGAGNVWLAADPYRLQRFHGWEGGHPGWRDHAIRNDRFRNDRNGHFHPRPQRGPGKGEPKKREEGH